MKENSRLHASKTGVPTIQLGDGGTAIASCGGHGFEGVCFAELGRSIPVGETYELWEEKQPTHEVGVYLQIVTKNPASLQVLIDALEDAKSELNGKK